MKGLENLTPELATDLIELVNSLKKLPKSQNVKYNVKNKVTGDWNKKEFNYVPLDDILEKIKENKNFAFMQPIGFDNESQKFGVKCVLIHKSGKYLESDVYEIPIKQDTKIQDEGAEITYRKRYSAGAFLGLATEDDTDGNDPEASNSEERKATDNQIYRLSQFYQGDSLERLLKENKVNSLEEISLRKASELIKIINELQEKKGKKQNGTN